MKQTTPKYPDELYANLYGVTNDIKDLNTCLIAREELRELLGRVEVLEMDLAEMRYRSNAEMAAAIYDFAGVLTSLPSELSFSVGAHHEAGPMVDAIDVWAKTAGIDINDPMVTELLIKRVAGRDRSDDRDYHD